MDRRKFFAASLVGAAAVVSPLGTAALAEEPKTKKPAPTAEPDMTDNDLKAFEAALADLPPELQEADPNTYPNYEEELKAQMSSGKSTPPGEVSPQFNVGPVPRQSLR